MPSNWLNFTKIRQALAFEQVLNHYGFEVALNSNGQGKIHCPFHEDQTPSCGVNTQKKAFKCFGCGAHGNVLEFVALMEGLDTSDTADLRKVAQFCVDTFDIDPGHKTPKGTQKAKKSTPRAKVNPKAESANSKAVAPNHASAAVEDQWKLEKPAAQVKLKKGRKTKRDGKAVATAENPTEGQAINKPLTFTLDLDSKHSFIINRNIDLQTAEKFGIGYYGGKGMHNGRICFPIHNEKGELIAYAGRWADGEIPNDTPRYLLPQGFQKQNVLFNIHRVLSARSHGYDFSTIVIVEGFWSAIHLHQFGIPVVATLGTSISDQQINLLNLLNVENAIILYDGDEAGRVGAKQIAASLSAQFWTKTIDLPENTSPDGMSDDILQTLPRFKKQDQS